METQFWVAVATAIGSLGVAAITAWRARSKDTVDHSAVAAELTRIATDQSVEIVRVTSEMLEQERRDHSECLDRVAAAESAHDECRDMVQAARAQIDAQQVEIQRGREQVSILEGEGARRDSEITELRDRLSAQAAALANFEAVHLARPGQIPPLGE